MRLVFLGTSSATPTRRRFLPSAALVRLGEMFLLDCGEGTQIRFKRLNLGLAPLSWILISHLHGDHITGLMGLLMSLQMGERNAPLRLVGPPGLREYVLTNKRLLRTDFGFPLEFVELQGRHRLVHESQEYVLEAALLDHRVPCYGYALAEKDRPGRFDLAAARALGVPAGPLFGQLQRGATVTLDDGREVRPEQVLGPARPGRRVAYVTDTRPCANGLLLARGADLLVHEATFGAELADDARVKKHSTAAEAATVARDAGAKRLVLTHVSPRYVDLEPLRAEAEAVFSPVELADDLREFAVDYEPEQDAATDAQ
jgi:ribonuclease Z